MQNTKNDTCVVDLNTCNLLFIEELYNMGITFELNDGKITHAYLESFTVCS